MFYHLPYSIPPRKKNNPTQTLVERFFTFDSILLPTNSHNQLKQVFKVRSNLIGQTSTSIFGVLDGCRNDDLGGGFWGKTRGRKPKDNNSALLLPSFCQEIYYFGKRRNEFNVCILEEMISGICGG